MNILIVAEHDNRELKSVNRTVLAAAHQLGGAIDVLIAGSDCAGVVESATKLPGIRQVLTCQHPALEAGGAEHLADLVKTIAGEYSHVLTPASTFGKNWAPRLAALLDVAQISDVLQIEAPDTFVRPIYAGSLWSTVRSSDYLRVLTTRPTAFDALGGEGVPVAVRPVEFPTSSSAGSRRLELSLNHSTRPELESARVVVSGGRGLGSAERYHELLEPLADRLDAALGASRAAVDSGYVPNDYQVGQTGKVVAPDLYLAIGISGAIQHLAGMKESKVIVAINKDPDAPIFAVADYGLVGDLNQLVPALTAAL